MKLQEIPQTWLIAGLLAGLVGLRAFSIDTWTTAALSTLMGYLTGRHIMQNRQIAAQDLDKISSV